jgi:hypothetical protein
LWRATLHGRIVLSNRTIKWEATESRLVIRKKSQAAARWNWKWAFNKQIAGH